MKVAILDGSALEISNHRRFEDLTGHRFGRLIVVGCTGKKEERRRRKREGRSERLK